MQTSLNDWLTNERETSPKIEFNTTGVISLEKSDWVLRQAPNYLVANWTENGFILPMKVFW